MRTRRAIYNIITNLLLQLSVIIYGLIMPRVIIDTYGSDVNGLISSITTFLAYISLVEAGFGGVVQFLLYKPIAKKDHKSINDILATSQKFFTRVSAIFIIYVAILCVVYPFIVESNFDSLFTISLILIISISTFSEYYFGLVYRVFLFADQKKYIVSLFSVLSYTLNIIAVLILSRFDVPVQVLKLVSTLLFVIRPILQNIYVRKKYKVNIKAGNKNYKIGQKWDALAQHIASVIHGSTDVAVLSIFQSLAEVSVYSVYALAINVVKKVTSMFYDSVSSGFGDMIARGENEKLNKVFGVVESLFFTFVTIIFACTFVLITPFVQVYTNGVTDANYIQPVFGYLIVLAELFSTTRFPYSSITLAAGHYKETRNGAIVECVLNLLISIALVAQFGLIGVTVGTMIAMLVRTCEFIYHSSKYILNRSIFIPIRKILLMGLEILIIVAISNLLPLLQNTGYINWVFNAIITLVLSSAICLMINCFVYRNDFIMFSKIFRGIFRKEKK